MIYCQESRVVYVQMTDHNSVSLALYYFEWWRVCWCLSQSQLGQVFCIFLFFIGASLFGTLLSQLNEILQVRKSLSSHDKLMNSPGIGLNNCQRALFSLSCLLIMILLCEIVLNQSQIIGHDNLLLIKWLPKQCFLCSRSARRLVRSTGISKAIFHSCKNTGNAIAFCLISIGCIGGGSRGHHCVHLVEFAWSYWTQQRERRSLEHHSRVTRFCKNNWDVWQASVDDSWSGVKSW